VTADQDRTPESGPLGRIPPYLRNPPAGGPAPANPGRDAASTGDYAVQPVGRPAAPRPFVLTSGRVDATDREISMETQVTVRPREAGVPVPHLGPETQAIVDMCGQPISVAEISARLHLHLGVTKILVADLRAAGHLDVHVVDTQNQLSPETILRVMRGLRAIS
jgi:hypothetical protein